jgi:hypothetical protein
MATQDPRANTTSPALMTPRSLVILEVPDRLDFIDVGATCDEFEPIYMVAHRDGLIRPEDTYAISPIPTHALGLFCPRPSRDPQGAGRRD